MNELENELVNVIRKAVSTGENALEFALDQAPELIHQLLLYKGIVSGLGVLLGLTICLISYRVFVHLDKTLSRYDISLKWFSPNLRRSDRRLCHLS